MSKKNMLPDHAYEYNWNIIPIGIGQHLFKYTEKPFDVHWCLTDNTKNKNNPGMIQSSNFLVVGQVGAGCSTVMAKIINHSSKCYNSAIEYIIIDCCNVSPDLFNHYRFMANNIYVAKDTIESIYNIMQARIKLINERHVKNIFALEHANVPHYVFDAIGNLPLQFDEIIDATTEFSTDNTKYYDKMHNLYPKDSYPYIISMEDVYKRLQAGSTVGEETLDKIFAKKNVKVTHGSYVPHQIMLAINDFDMLMMNDNKELVNDIKKLVTEICRFGRAAGISVILKCARVDNKILPKELKNNIFMSLLLGKIDKKESIYLFGTDVSNEYDFKKKGRGIIKTCDGFIEVQVYE